MLTEFFVRYDDGWYQGRCDRELASMSNKADSNRENGKLGGRPAKPNGNPDVTQMVSGNGRKEKPNGNPDGSYARAGPLPTTHYPLPTTHYPLPTTQGTSKPTKVKNTSAEAAPTAATWEAYAGAYHLRYGVEPVRNAKINGQFSKFIQRIPQNEAPHVAAFFLKSNRALYVSAKHCVDLLLRDAESLRTEWATGQTVTDAEARQIDRTQTNLNVWGKLIEEAESNEGKQGTH
jgi:hypothetical protein